MARRSCSTHCVRGSRRRRRPTHPTRSSPVGTLKVAVHRMRRRFRDLLIASVRDTLDSTDDTVDELAELLEALR